jgi:nucleotide-binding universal stress UspA family protein
MTWTIEKTILVPFDFSEPSHAAIDKALEIAAQSSQVHVLHVLPPFVPLAPEGIPIEWSDDRLRIEQAQKHLEKELEDRRYQGVVCEVLIGDPGTECADRAERLNADLIVVPSHGKSGLTRFLLGSVTERIVRLSKRPVLVLKI